MFIAMNCFFFAFLKLQKTNKLLNTKNFLFLKISLYVHEGQTVI